MSRFDTIHDLPGWCPEELMAWLNLRATQVSKDECYLEIGTFCGRSVIAALLDNTTKAHVIDPLDLETSKGNIFDLWSDAIKEFGLLDRVKLHRVHAEEFNDELPPVNLFFYDGNHDSGHTYEGLKKYERYLTDKATIVVDDYNIYGGTAQTPFPGHEIDINSPVKTDTDRWIDENQEKIVQISFTPWLNGQAIIEYSR